MRKKVDFFNVRFGRLVVIEDAGKNKKGHRMLLCKCDCGKIKSIASGSLNRGHTKSCGCLREEGLKNNRNTHGHRVGGKSSSTYNSWCSMIRRCTDKEHADYGRYGAKGVFVCKRWLEKFENFLEDMGEKPSIKHSIDRINNKDGYRKENCRWATMKEQSNNRTNNNLITANGETKTLAQWSEIIGIHRSTIEDRLAKGMSPEEAIAKKKTKEKADPLILNVNGRTISLAEISRESGIKKGTLWNRIFTHGMTLNEAISVPVRPWGSKKSTAVKRTDVEVFNDVQFIDSDFQPGRTDCIAASS